MGKFDGILICTDLDGTLYRDDKTVSKKNKEAIEYFKSEGGYFTFITGRLPYYSQHAYGIIEPNAPFGCDNGGALYDGVKDEYVFTTELDKRACDLIDAVDRGVPGVGIQVVCFHKTYFSKENDTMVTFRAAAKIPNLVCHYREVSEPVAKIIFGTEIEEEVILAQKILSEHPLSSEFTFVRSERTLFEILPKGVTKGLAFEKLVHHLGVESTKTVAIGDYDNDVGMLKTARYGIAVSNASHKAKAAADIITVSNEEHAIARVIYDIESGKIAF